MVFLPEAPPLVVVVALTPRSQQGATPQGRLLPFKSGSPRVRSVEQASTLGLTVLRWQVQRVVLLEVTVPLAAQQAVLVQLSTLEATRARTPGVVVAREGQTERAQKAVTA